jgi:hypothetical protein
VPPNTSQAPLYTTYTPERGFATRLTSGITRADVGFTALWYAGRATLAAYPHPALGHVNSARAYWLMSRSRVWHGAQSSVVPPTETHVSTTDGHDATFVSPLAAQKTTFSRANRGA